MSYLKSISKIVIVMMIGAVMVALLTLRISNAALPAVLPTGTPPPTPTEPSVPPPPVPTDTPVPPTSVPQPTAENPPPVETPTPTPTPTPTALVTLPETGGVPEDGGPVGPLFVLAGALLLAGVGFMAWRQKRAS